MVAPIILVLIILIARNKKIMGNWKNGRLTSSLGWLLAALMTVSGIAAIYSLFP
jgi:Mn2+/Fe2+ NRAMP family transporter